MIVINGMSPGPVLEANLGDQVIVNVLNNMTNETAVHWHGQYQRGTNFMDGTYAITQVGEAYLGCGGGGGGGGGVVVVFG
jgi:iron transport multicopper oxidase